MNLSREAAWQLLTEWTGSESLRKHALAVEAAVRGYARQQGANARMVRRVQRAKAFRFIIHDGGHAPWSHPARLAALRIVNPSGHARATNFLLTCGIEAGISPAMSALHLIRRLRTRRLRAGRWTARIG